MGELPLDGIRVIDLSRVLAGPLCTMMLGDLGADVIKVERPGTGDETRSWGPPFVGGQSAYFLSVNRNKRSVAIDLTQQDGVRIVRELIAGADVVVENFKAGGATALGLDLGELRDENPGLITCSITGFGSRRKPADRPGYDFIVQAESGLMAITGATDGEPMKVGVALVDVLTGQNAAAGILAKLVQRGSTGLGGHVEVSLLDSAIAALVNVASSALATGMEPERHGNAHPSIVPYQPFKTSDGLMAVAAANDGLFRRLCDVVGMPELADDPGFLTNPDRVRNRDRLVELLSPWFTRHATDDALDALSRAGVPAGEVLAPLAAIGAAAAAGDPLVQKVTQADGEPVQIVQSPLQFDGERLPMRLPPPLLGQHGEEVLRLIQPG